MSKLLSANLSRLFKSKVFWLTAAAMLAINTFAVIMVGTNPMNDPFDIEFFAMMPSFGLYAAFFSSMFLGTEYSDLTIRNKLIVGHSRSEVFFANLFTCLIAAAIFFIVWAGTTCIGIPFFGAENIVVKPCLLKAMVGFFTLVSVTSIMSVISQLITRKAVIAVTAIFAALALILLGSYFYNMLCEPETNLELVNISEDGSMEFNEVPNPAYIAGVLRPVYEAILRVLPTGQQILLADEPLSQPALMIAVSLAVTVVVSVIGYLFFRKKDLK